MLTSTIPTPAARLLSTLDALAEIEPGSLTGRAQADLLRVLARAEAQLCAVRMKVLAAAEQAGTPAASGASGTGAWAAKVANGDQAPAHRDAILATGLTERTATATALAAGRISRQHAEVIVHATDQLPHTLTAAQRATVEADLVTRAESLPPQALRRAARRALAAVEPDERVVDTHENQLIADEETTARAKTRLTLRDNADGTVTGHFTVPTHAGHLLRKILQAMTAPRRARPGATQAHAGHPSERTDWDHARGLAFTELLEHLPTDHLHPKVAATLIIKIDHTQLHDQLKAADLDTGAQLSAGLMRRLACNAGLVPAVLDGPSQVLDLGRHRRLFTQAQRLALSLRHDTCAAHGCQRPYAWCELHHRQPWSRGGRTDLADAVPLCHFHHQRIHDPTYTHHQMPDGTIEFRLS